MKVRNLLTLTCLLVTGILAPSGKAQDAKGPEFGDHFIFHETNLTSYYFADDNRLAGGLVYLQQFKKTIDSAALAGRYEIGLFTKLNPKLTDYNGAPVRAIGKIYASYTISDGSDALLVALGITKENVQDYRYHVVKNDSIEIVPWSPIPHLEQKYGADRPYAAIGTFNAANGTIMVEVVNTKKYSIRDGVIYDWRENFQPFVESIEVNTPNNFYELKNLKKNRGFAKSIDPVTGSPLHIEFPADTLTGIWLNLRHHETIPYNVYIEKLDGDSAGSTRLSYYMTDDRMFIRQSFIKQPGKYQIKVVRVGYEKTQALYIPFEIKPPPPPVTEKKVSLKQALPYIIATLSGVALLFFIYYRRNQNKLKTAEREKQMAALKLKSIRSQLNPHFMFNALTSIQNLINKNDIKGANYYLSIFSGLTRQVLDSNNEEQLSLEEELKILDDYLQMEQLRFGFQYEINAADYLNQANIEIPAMLLQPFVENAVKHGVSGMKQEGRIQISVRKEDHDLVLSVTDNGKGFIPDPQSSGYGLKLSRERVNLLNQIYKDQSLTLTIAAQEGSTVTLRLLNWIS
jgi:two-component system LytT family sensor kinase